MSGCSSGVEHNLAKVGVGRSNRLTRSNSPRCRKPRFAGAFVFLGFVIRAGLLSLRYRPVIASPRVPWRGHCGLASSIDQWPGCIPFLFLGKRKREHVAIAVAYRRVGVEIWRVPQVQPTVPSLDDMRSGTVVSLSRAKACAAWMTGSPEPLHSACFGAAIRIPVEIVPVWRGIFNVVFPAIKCCHSNIYSVGFGSGSGMGLLRCCMMKIS